MVKPVENYDLRVAPDGMGFFLENMSADADATQFIRELTQNSIEAVARAGQDDGKVLWTVDEEIHKNSRGRQSKLTLIDNGDGMTGEELVGFINQLASSASKKAHDGNFGIGAKITAGVLNPAGLVYVSWKNGVGSKVHFWKDPDTGRYGLKPLKRKDGSYGPWTDILDCKKPETIIGDSGTKVVLLGKSKTNNTAEPPAKSEFKGKDWIARYLGSHYTSLPDNVEIRCSSQPTSDFAQGEHVETRTEYFERQAIENGTVILPGVRAHWWLLDDVHKNERAENKGHVGVVFQDELYEARMKRSGHGMLSNAGIIAGGNRVVIYFEPQHNARQVVKPNISRGNITIDSKPVPIVEWLNAFAEKMPEELREYVDSLLKRNPQDHETRMRKRLEGYSDLFASSAYALSPEGTHNVEGAGNAPDNDPPKQPKTPGGSRPPRGPQENDEHDDLVDDLLVDIFDETASPSSDKGEERKAVIFPSISWITSETDHDLDDRAAKYDVKSNQLLVNTDFRGYTDLLTYLLERYPDDSRTEIAVEQTLQEYYGQVLSEVVMGIRNLSEHGTSLQSEYHATMLSPEALTASVMVRSEICENVMNALKVDGFKPLSLKGPNGPTPT